MDLIAINHLRQEGGGPGYLFPWRLPVSLYCVHSSMMRWGWPPLEFGCSVHQLGMCSKDEPNSEAAVSGRGGGRQAVRAGTPAPPLLGSPSQGEGHTHETHVHSRKGKEWKEKMHGLVTLEGPPSSSSPPPHWPGLCHLPLSTAKESGKLHIFSQIHCQAK